MWQRVQTLYLAISTILIGVMVFVAKAAIYGGDGVATQTLMFTDYMPYTILLIMILIFNIIALCAYKFLVFQLRTTMLASLIILALQVWLGVDFYLTHNDVVFKLPALFPFAALVLNLLAYRGILADQLLVESAYSLRKSRRERRANRK